MLSLHSSLGSLRAREALVLLVLGLAIAPPQALATEGVRTYRVVDVDRDDVLNIRSGPSVSYPVVGEIPPTGRGVELIGPCRGWCLVRYRGASGWVHGRYLAAEPVVARYVERTPAEERPPKSARPDRQDKPQAPDKPAAASGPTAPSPPAASIMSATIPPLPAASAPDEASAVPKHWRVTGVPANSVLFVRGGPKEESPVVFVYSPRATCIVYVGGCQKPWCQVQYPTDQGPRVGWVDARFLTPAEDACR